MAWISKNVRSFLWRDSNCLLCDLTGFVYASINILICSKAIKCNMFVPLKYIFWHMCEYMNWIIILPRTNNKSQLVDLYENKNTFIVICMSVEIKLVKRGRSSATMISYNKNCDKCAGYTTLLLTGCNKMIYWKAMSVEVSLYIHSRIYVS